MHTGDLSELQEAGLNQSEKDALLDVMKRARVRREGEREGRAREGERERGKSERGGERGKSERGGEREQLVIVLKRTDH